MVKFMKTWCEGIIVAIMISLIIESILPEGNSKKYVKIIIGIYIIFVILNPILQKNNAKIDFEHLWQGETIKTETDMNSSVKDVYIKGIETSIKEDLNQQGYPIQKVTIYVDNSYETIEKIIIQKGESDQNIIMINPIYIGKNSENHVKEDAPLKEYVSERYGVEIENIILQ